MIWSGQAQVESSGIRESGGSEVATRWGRSKRETGAVNDAMVGNVAAT